jgi:hypothetical protein
MSKNTLLVSQKLTQETTVPWAAQGEGAWCLINGQWGFGLGC